MIGYICFNSTKYDKLLIPDNRIWFYNADFMLHALNNISGYFI